MAWEISKLGVSVVAAGYLLDAVVTATVLDHKISEAQVLMSENKSHQ